MKSSFNEDIQEEIEQLLTCLNLEKPRISQDKQFSTNSIDRFVKLRSTQTPKYSSFNPFPSRSFNENVAANGYKFGLYSPIVTNR